MIPMQYALRRRMMMAVRGDIDVAALSITYSGAHTDYGMVTMSDGAQYRLLAFTASGTLSIEQSVDCEVCVVGGGANGAKSTSMGAAGGAGAYLKNQSVSAYNGGPVVVGAGQGVSSIADVSVNAVSGKNGGTGAGGTTGGKGDGLSKYPFEDTGYSLWAGKPHCAGGGSGISVWSDGKGYSGGNGGTNGGKGYQSSSDYLRNPSGGVGGSYGGGKGGGNGGTPTNGENATYYGSGAGGGCRYINDSNVATAYNGGSGYQGIVYIRIPVIQ